MYSKLLKTYPSTLSYIRNYVCHKHTIHNILVLNVRTCIVYVYYILIFIFVSNKFISRSKIYLFLIVGDIGGSKQPAPQEVLERKHSRVQSIIKHWLKWRISRLYNLLVDVAICWEMLVSVGVCWGLLGYVGVCWGLLGVGRRNRLFVDARVADTQESQRRRTNLKVRKDSCEKEASLYCSWWYLNPEPWHIAC